MLEVVGNGPDAGFQAVVEIGRLEDVHDTHGRIAGQRNGFLDDVIGLRGHIDGDNIICGLHGWDYVFHTGVSAYNNAERLAKFSSWVEDDELLVDADEIITEEVRRRLIEIASRPTDSVVENGFFINRLTYFMGRPIRHCGYFPSWNLRFFKRGLGFYEDREVHEHVVIDDPVGYIKEAMIHDDRRGLDRHGVGSGRFREPIIRGRGTHADGKKDQSPWPERFPKEPHALRPLAPRWLHDPRRTRRVE